MLFNKNKQIYKKLVIVIKIHVKLIFRKYFSLNQDEYCKFEAIDMANHKNNIIKAMKKNFKP